MYKRHCSESKDWIPIGNFVEATTDLSTYGPSTYSPTAFSPAGESQPSQASSPPYISSSSPPRSPSPSPVDAKPPAGAPDTLSAVTLVQLNFRCGPEEKIWGGSGQLLILFVKVSLFVTQQGWTEVLELIRDSAISVPSKNRLRKYIHKCERKVGRTFERLVKAVADPGASFASFSPQTLAYSRHLDEYVHLILRLVRIQVALLFPADSPLLNVLDHRLFNLAHQYTEGPFKVLRRLEILRGLGSYLQVLE